MVFPELFFCFGRTVLLDNVKQIHGLSQLLTEKSGYKPGIPKSQQPLLRFSEKRMDLVIAVGVSLVRVTIISDLCRNGAAAYFKVALLEPYPDEITKYYPLVDLLMDDTARELCSEKILSLIKPIPRVKRETAIANSPGLCG